MLTKVRRAMNEQSENFKKEIENIFLKYQKEIIELKNKSTELKTQQRGSTADQIKQEIKDQQTQRQGSGIHPTREAKRKKNEKE